MKLVDWIVGLALWILIGWLVLQTPWGKSVVSDFIKGFRADQEQSR
jgi:nucleoside permease NupC